MNELIVFLNNSFVPAAQANISIFDRGILYGDGLFETMRAYKGRVFALQEHLDRLSFGANILKMPLKHTADINTKTCRNIIQKLIKLNNLDKCDSYIRITLTRGIDCGGLIPKDSLKPTLIVVAKPLAVDVLKKRQRVGIKGITLNFSKLHSIASIVKSLNFLDNVLGSVTAAACGADEAIFLNTKGEVLEGTTSNIFAVKDGAITTPSLASGILSGITRKFIIDISQKSGMSVKETAIKLSDIIKSKEAFITNSIIEVVPLIRINKRVIGSGRPGKITRLIHSEYKKVVNLFVS